MKHSDAETYSRWHSLPSEEDLSKPRVSGITPSGSSRASFEVSTFVIDDAKYEKTEAISDVDTESISSKSPTLPDYHQSQDGLPQDELEPIMQNYFGWWPVRDTSWLTAATFTAGSAVFVINSFFSLLPMVEPGMNFEGEGEYAGPATSILGTVIFLVGAWVQILEALNIKRGEVDGIGIGVGDEEERDDAVLLEKELEEGIGFGKMHHRLVDTSLSSASRTRSALIGSEEFIWVPSLYELRAYYLWNPMFIGALVQMIGAIIFAIATVTAIPGVMDVYNPVLLNTFSLLPTLVGGVCFLAAGLIQAAATQEVWYIPTPWLLEWHMGFWNSIGALGFALAGGLPYIGHPAAMFQATLATFWGSWSFLIGSVVQWIVVMENYS